MPYSFAEIYTILQEAESEEPPMQQPQVAPTQDQTQKPLQSDDNPSKGSPLISQDPDLWEKFADIANSNAEDVADLLGVDKEVASTWYQKIQQALEQSQREKSSLDSDVSVKTGNGEEQNLKPPQGPVGGAGQLRGY